MKYYDNVFKIRCRIFDLFFPEKKNHFKIFQNGLVTTIVGLEMQSEWSRQQQFINALCMPTKRDNASMHHAGHQNAESETISQHSTNFRSHSVNVSKFMTWKSFHRCFIPPFHLESFIRSTELASHAHENTSQMS